MKEQVKRISAKMARCAVDGMDSRHIWRGGPATAGRYAAAYLRQNGPIKKPMTTNVYGSMAYFNGPDAG